MMVRSSNIAWILLFTKLFVFTIYASDVTQKPSLFDCLKLRNFDKSSQAVCAKKIGMLERFLANKTANNPSIRTQKPDPNDEQATYVISLFEKVLNRTEKWVRKEVRKLTKEEWKNFTDAINTLKNTPLGNNNQYDAIAMIHSGITLYYVHRGPSFLGWHRMYLLLLEAALGVPIPYWDSRLDNNMKDPQQSVLWSSLFLGNGYGAVKTGPFANWTTRFGPLCRNYSSDGKLINADDLTNVLNMSHTWEISSNTSCYPENLEKHHNHVHNWVGGFMSILLSAPQDPVFFLHHSFIDYVWQMFRNNQRDHEINPADDYPDLPFNSSYDKTLPMVGFYDDEFTYNDGYSDRFEQLTEYESSPIESGECNSDSSWPYPVLHWKVPVFEHNEICVPAEGVFNPNELAPVEMHQPSCTDAIDRISNI